VFDAAAIHPLAERRELLRRLGGRAVLTPNADEMASLLDLDADELRDDPAGIVRQAASDLGVTIAMQGTIAAPGSEVYENETGGPWLATSGSGDVLAGAVAGLLARGADPLPAAIWGVHVHGLAGDRLAERNGRVGTLARELLQELAPALASLD
jgi:NAD(P)H-hydrate repair Nnr-like enzyme with NAD(P)H-hydrate dehydratase domain